MLSLRQAVSGVAAAAVLWTSPALADWEADLHFKSAAAGEEMKGRAYGAQGVMRMDLQTAHGGMSNIIDWKKRTAVTLMHARKMAMQADMKRVGVAGGDCESTQDVEQCLLSRGYKKVGTEQANGHPCTVYERKEAASKGSRAEHVKLWRPQDVTEVPFLRTLTFDAQGKLVSQFNLTNLKVAAQPASRFQVPRDYQQLQSPAKGAAGVGGLNASELQGKTPEQLRELMMKRYGQGAPQLPSPQEADE